MKSYSTKLKEEKMEKEKIEAPRYEKLEPAGKPKPLVIFLSKDNLTLLADTETKIVYSLENNKLIKIN